ncbi:MAG: tetratricopeptide repeat protein [Myxococcota bacterium]
MDIWRWINDTERELRHAGQDRLARLVGQLSHVVCDGRHGQVDAMVPEALALARAAKSPWLEVFIRHWHLQSLIFHRYRVREALPKAVSLLEFASREESRDCPQSVCATQDLAQCYSQLDGPGYVAERLAVAQESLDRIDPSWPCFVCISDEYAGALCDGRRFDEVVEFVAEQRRAMTRAGGRFDPSTVMCSSAVRALLGLGRHAEALVEAERWDTALSGKHSAMGRDLFRALALIRQGRLAEGAALVPSSAQVLEMEGNYIDWARCVRDMAAHLRPGDDRPAGDDPAGAGELSWVLGWECDRDLWRMQRGLVALGALYPAATLAKIAAQLAVIRGRRATAAMWLEAAEEPLPELRAPERLRQQLDEVAASIAALPELEVPDGMSMDEFLASIGRDPERAAELFGAARRRWPDRLKLTNALAQMLYALGRVERAEQLLRRCLEDAPESEQILSALAETLIDSDRHDQLAELLDRFGDAPPPWVLRLRARSAYAQRDMDRCAEALEAALAAEPDDHNGRAVLAQVERERGNWQRAVDLLDLVVEHSGPGDADWDRMVAASVIGAWAKVRHSARRIGLDFDPGDEPITVDGELCLIRIRDGAWQERDFLAQRTGPVTARIMQIAGPGRAEHFLDEVVFDPAPINPPDSSDAGDDSPPDGDSGSDGDARQLLIFASVHTLHPGAMVSYSIDGVHPGDEAMEAVAAAASKHRGVISVRSGDDYVLDLPGDADSAQVSGIYAFIAVPTAVKPHTLHRLLSQATSDLEHPLVWLELAAALGDEAEFSRQRTIAERYGL